MPLDSTLNCSLPTLTTLYGPLLPFATLCYSLLPLSHSFPFVTAHQVHSKGKRRFHPYCEVTLEGRVEKRIFTMDGEEVSELSELSE